MTYLAGESKGWGGTPWEEDVNHDKLLKVVYNSIEFGLKLT